MRLYDVTSQDLSDDGQPVFDKTSSRKVKRDDYEGFRSI